MSRVLAPALVPAARYAWLAAALVLATPAIEGSAAGQDAVLDDLGRFEHAPGAPGIVVAAPHGTADAGTIALARALADRLGAGVVLASGFVVTGQEGVTRINVNRPSEQLRIADRLRVLRSPRATLANARYTALIKETAAAPLRFFLEIHSNTWPEAAGLVLVGSVRVTTAQALRFKATYLAAAADSIPVSSNAPRLGIRVAPVDALRFSFRESSTIAELTEQGLLIELPSVVTRNDEWLALYARVLGDTVQQYLTGK